MSRPTYSQLDAFDRTQRMSLTELREEFEKLETKPFRIKLRDIIFVAKVERVTHVESLTPTGYDHVRVRLVSDLSWERVAETLHQIAQGLYDTVDTYRRHGEIKDKIDKFNFGRSIQLTPLPDGQARWVFELEFL